MKKKKLPLKSHIKTIIRTERSAVPWPRMILCSIAALLPLLVGHFQHQLSLCIYGSLSGYLLALNDHLGQVRHRMWVITLTFLLLALGFTTGYLLQSSPIVFQTALCGLVYWLGILGGDGDELERGVLFAVLTMIIVFFSKSIFAPDFKIIFLYCLLSFVCILIGIPFLNILRSRTPEPFARLKDSFQKSLAPQIEKHIHAAAYTASALAAVWIALSTHIERGYWISITVLLVMRADRTQSIYKTLQRLIGTAGAVLLCDLFLPREFYPLILISLIGLSAFLVPIGLKKNYLFASFFVTILVLMLLELAAPQHGDTTNAFFRLRATLIGCTISLLGSLLSKILANLHLFFKKEIP